MLWRSMIECARWLPWGRRLAGLIGLTALVACHTQAAPAGPTAWATREPGLITPPPTSPVTRASPATLPQAAASPSASRVAAIIAMSPTPAASEQAPYRLGAGPAVPGRLRAALQEFAGANGDLFRWVADDDAEISVTLGAKAPAAAWVYAVVAPFATIQDEISLAEVQEAWAAGQLQVTEADLPLWQAFWGNPAVGLEAVPAGELTAHLWQERTATSSPLGLMPFDELEPALKVLTVDGHSPLVPALGNEAWPMTVHFSPAGAPEAVAAFQARWSGVYSNRQPERISRVALTGVTALTRATAYQMEINGVNYPGEDVARVLQAADVAHASHEVAFSPNCPFPNPLGGTSFCARDSYLGLLTYVGIDVVELTGNHVNDFGAANLARSVGLYEAAGMQVYGGGRDLAEAGRPALFDLSENKVAFVGCNPAGPSYAWATTLQAGANPCDYQALYDQIGTLRADGYIVLATLQYPEHYDYLPTSSQRADFRALITAGAHAVSGSQGHHAMTFDLYQGGFVHYGPGNLFFDQMQMLGTRETFVDTYVIHDGKLLSVVLWTGLIENYARPRQMSPSERAATLGRVFSGSRYEP